MLYNNILSAELARIAYNDYESNLWFKINLIKIIAVIKFIVEFVV